MDGPSDSAFAGAVGASVEELLWGPSLAGGLDVVGLEEVDFLVLLFTLKLLKVHGFSCAMHNRHGGLFSI